MSDYRTDQEQVELIKQWWHDYGKYLGIAVVLGIILGFAWRSWHNHEVKQSAQASQIYEQLLIADARMDLGGVNKITQQLIANYPNSAYTVMAKLLLAKEAIEEDKLNDAIQHLQWVIDHGHNPSFRQIARIRMARILLAEHNTKDALQVLATVDDATFQPAIAAIQGDIYMAMGNNTKAHDAYATAQQQFLANDMEDSMLKLKLTQPLSASANVAEPKEQLVKPTNN